jgi:phosphatidylethanolamine/phosphatidyl-N-methylethanolamine N-methyltransferase
MPFLTYVTEFGSFLRSWISDPFGVAAIAPSSKSLARLITSEIQASDGPVMELGVGTGVFTRALLDRGVRQEDLTLVECGADFAAVLQGRFPLARVIQVDAARLATQNLYSVAGVGSVISGLPLLFMPPRKVMAILAGTFDYMRPDGCFYQFTYFPRCPVPRLLLDRLGLKATRIGGTVLNLPPASVYRITRRQPFSVSRRLLSSSAQPRLLSHALAINN